MTAERLHIDQDYQGNAVLNALLQAAPDWAPGRQLGGALTWDAVEQALFRVRLDIADSQTRPGLNPNNYRRVVPLSASSSTGDYYPQAYNPPAALDGDWYPAIQAALDAAAAEGGGRVYLRAGIYYVSQTLRVPSNVSLVGAGKYCVTVIRRGVDGPACTVPPETTDFEVAKIHFKNANSNIDRNTSGIAYGLYVNGRQGQVWKCEASSAVAGIVLNGAQDCLVFGNYVHDTVADGMSMFGADYGPNLRNQLVNNKFRHIGDDGIGEVWYKTYTSICNEGNLIMGNTFLDIQATGIDLWGGINTTVCGNKIDNTFNAGIRVTAAASIGFGGVQSANIYGNTIIRAGKFPTRHDSGPSSVTEQCGGIVIKAYGDSDLIADIKLHNNTIIEPAGSYIMAFSKGTAPVFRNLSITENTGSGGCTIPTYVAGKEPSGLAHGIWICNAFGTTVLSGNTIEKAWGCGICIENSVGTVKMTAGNTVDDCNQGNISPVAGISVRSPVDGFLFTDNEIRDPNNRIVNAVYYVDGIGELKCEAANNLLGGRAISGTPAAGSGGTAPVASTYTLSAPATVEPGQAFNFTVTSSGSQVCHHIDTFYNSGNTYIRTYNQKSLPATLSQEGLSAGTYTFFAAVYTSETAGYETNRVTVQVGQPNTGAGGEQADAGGNAVDTTSNARRYKENFGVTQSDGSIAGWHIGLTGEGGTFSQGYFASNSQNLLMQIRPNETGYMGFQTNGALYDLLLDPTTIKWFDVPAQAGQETAFGIHVSAYNRALVRITDGGEMVVETVVYSGSGSPTYTDAPTGVFFTLEQHRYLRFRMVKNAQNQNVLRISTSGDNATYTVLREIANPFATTQFGQFVYTGSTAASPNPGVVEVDYIEYTA